MKINFYSRILRLDSNHIRLADVALVILLVFLVNVVDLVNASLAGGDELGADVALTVACGIDMRHVASENASAIVAYSVAVRIRMTLAYVVYLAYVALCVKVLVLVLIALDIYVGEAEAAPTVVVVINVSSARSKLLAAVIAESVGIAFNVSSAAPCFVYAEDSIFKPRIVFL